MVRRFIERNVGEDSGRVHLPALIVEYTGDQACFPGDVRSIVDALPSNQKRMSVCVATTTDGRSPTTKNRAALLPAGVLPNGFDATS